MTPVLDRPADHPVRQPLVQPHEEVGPVGVGNSAVFQDRPRLTRRGGKPRSPATIEQLVLAGRYHVTGEDLRVLALPVLRHRVLTNYQAESDGKSVDDVLREVVNR